MMPNAAEKCRTKKPTTDPNPMKIRHYILNRLSEASTWRGITMLLTALGIGIDPEQAAAITGAGLAIVGVINVFKKDAGSPDKA